MSDKKVIGILGGMGPLATADLFQKITLHTAASCDQDHPRVCIDSNTNISDRTAALLHGGADPVPEMVKSAQRLESIGADLLIMPCNTAHNFYDAVASSVSIPVLHMIAITRDALKSRGVKCAGLLATDGTVQTGIYQRTFEGSGVELLTPDNTEDQSAVMDIIYNGVKAGDLTHDATAFRAACEHLLARGAEVLILGCTELPPRSTSIISITPMSTRRSSWRLLLSAPRAVKPSEGARMSYADQVFRANCLDILQNGVRDDDLTVRPHWEDGTPAHTIKKFGLVNRYDLQKEFPILTLRRTYLKSAVDELLWIWQKKSNNVHDLSSHIWDAWADETGSIGKAYGYQLGVKHQYKEGMFDQVDRVLYDLRHNPASRRILTSLYNFEDLHDMNLYPCAYSMTFNVSNGTLNAILNQRSQDMLAANNWNVCQYAVLVHMFAQVSGLKAGELVHVIADAHIYDRHIPIIEKMLSEPEHPAPQFTLDPAVTDFYAFTPDSVRLENYQFSPFEDKIPIAV